MSSTPEPNPKNNTDNRPYRPCVGIILTHPDGRVLVGDRIDKKGENWQLPQGGIDDGETPEQSAWRELYEETGVDKHLATLTHMSDDWIAYDLPTDISHKIWGGKYRGQQQKWAVFQFHGSDSDINLTVHHQEFSRWQWIDFAETPNHIVPFKRELYETIVAKLSPYVIPFSPKS